MKVTSIDLYSDRFEENLRFSLQHTSPFDKYMIRQIVGLDAEELVPKFYSFGRYHAKEKKFFEFTMKPRDVAMRVILNPNFKNNESYSDIRDELYKMISATRTGELILYFNSGATTVAQLKGFVTKFEAGYFQALPEAQITIRCEEPLFKGVASVIYDIDDSEYPDPIIVDGSLQVPDSLSTAPHGFSLTAVYNASSLGHSLFSVRDEKIVGDMTWEFRVSVAFAAGDVLHLSSVEGEKTLYVDRAVDSSREYLLDRINSTLTGAGVWPIVFPGQNSFYIEHLDDGIMDINHVEYYPTYWGV